MCFDEVNLSQEVIKDNLTLHSILFHSLLHFITNTNVLFLFVDCPVVKYSHPHLAFLDAKYLGLTCYRGSVDCLFGREKSLRDLGTSSA